MRKLNYFALAALAATAINVQAQTTYANPKDEDGFYIVKWDMEKGAFAESNDWEVDETFVFAIDLTGTQFADAIGQPSRNSSVLGRGLAYDLYPTSSPEEVGTASIDGRLFHIKDNVYGMVVNFYQQHTTRYKDQGLVPNEDYTEYGATTEGAVTTWDGNVFPFGWSADNAGAEWWADIATPSQGEFAFRCAPYTGTKKSPDYFYGDVTPADFCPLEGLDAGAFHSMCDAWGGYAAPAQWAAVKALEGSGVSNVAGEAQTVSSVYYDLQGRKITEPAQGLYIRQDVKADGTTKTVKVVK